MKPPTYLKEVRNFIGVVNYYRDMWARRFHTLAPLTKIKSSKVKFKWNKTEQDAFNEIKRIFPWNILLTYQDFNEYFKIYANSNHFQLRAVISQKVKSIALYGIKLTDAYRRYTVTEKELLSIVETLK